MRNLKERHRKILELVLSGLKDKDVAEEMSMTSAGIRLIRKSPCFQAELVRRRTAQTEVIDQSVAKKVSDAREILHEASREAADVQVRLLDSDNESIRQKSAMDILDRSGYPRVLKNDSVQKTLVMSLTPKELQDMQDITKRVIGKDLEIFDDEEPHPEPREAQEVPSSGKSKET